MVTLPSKSVLSTAEGFVVLQDTCGSPVFLLSSQAGSGLGHRALPTPVSWVFSRVTLGHASRASRVH